MRHGEASIQEIEVERHNFREGAQAFPENGLLGSALDQLYGLASRRAHDRLGVAGRMLDLGREGVGLQDVPVHVEGDRVAGEGRAE